ncbi:MAG TPA: glycoside hydrolase family 2 TIM barrel-domain containing protein [Nocardioidaceae bacterium]|jgi:beta-galactosidase/beta-glucuronidase
MSITGLQQATYPRPLLRRERWTDLSGRWSFGFDDDDQGLEQRWFNGADLDRAIRVPYPPESKLSEVGDRGDHPVLWYQRRIPDPAPGPGDRVLLHFGAVDYKAQVWVNGSLAVEHEGGHTPFHAEITHLLEPGAEQLITVRAEDRRQDVHKPRGKQDWRAEPHKVWYHRTSGIWQPVWLELVPDLHVTGLHWTAVPQEALVVLEATLNRVPDPGATLEVTLHNGGRLLAEQTTRCGDVRVRMHLPIVDGEHDQDLDGLLWSPESPTLLDARLRLVPGDTAPHRLADAVRSYVGYRSVGADRGRVLLNGRPYQLRMVLGQGYWPESHLAAPDPAALEAEVRCIKELGFNGVRVHQKIEDPRFLHACDRLGLLVWEEMPSAYAHSSRAVHRLTREWLEVLERDRSHPSVVAWVPFNESWGVRWLADRQDQRSVVTGLYHLTRAVDPTRLVIANDGWENASTDVVGIHDYAPTGEDLFSRYSHPDLLHRTLTDWGPGPARVLLDATTACDQRPVMVTEFGGIGFMPEDGSGQFVYSRADDLEDFLRQLTEQFGALHHSTDLAGFCYTQLTDTEQEVNGLLTADRQPKAPAPRIRQIVTGTAKPHPRPLASEGATS